MPNLSNRDEIRSQISAHLNARKSVEELDIDRNKPADMTDFAFVGKTPKRTIRSTYYRCSFCETDEKFSEGRIVLSSDGRLRLIGDICWSNHLDAGRYEAERNDWKDYQRRQRFELLRDEIRPKLDTAVASLQASLAKNRDVLYFVEKLPADLTHNASAFFDELTQARRNQGALSVDRHVMDYTAVERGGNPRQIVQSIVIHRVAGLDAALGPVPCFGQVIETALKALASARSAIHQTDWEKLGNATSVNIIKKIVSDTRIAISETRRIRDHINDTSLLLSEDNINGILKWSLDNDCELQLYGNLYRITNGIRFIDNNKRIFDMVRPNDLSSEIIIDLSDLENLIERI